MCECVTSLETSPKNTFHKEKTVLHRTVNTKYVIGTADQQSAKNCYQIWEWQIFRVDFSVCA